MPISGVHHLLFLVGRTDRDRGAPALSPRRIQHQDIPEAKGVGQAGVQVRTQNGNSKI